MEGARDFWGNESSLCASRRKLLTSRRARWHHRTAASVCFSPKGMRSSDCGAAEYTGTPVEYRRCMLHRVARCIPRLMRNRAKARSTARNHYACLMTAYGTFVLCKSACIQHEGCEGNLRSAIVIRHCWIARAHAKALRNSISTF